MVTITMRYEGELHCEAVHGPTSTTLATDAPADNMGKGQSFSPTDLVATALGTCILTTMGIVATRIGVIIDGATAVVEKQMTSSPPRRIAALSVRISMPASIAAEHRETLEQAAHHCPVAKSLHGDTMQALTFDWQD